jgi:peptide methionine sulfoxide reductase MsrB
MVKVVSPQTEREVSCRKCGSKLSYVFTDVKEQNTVDIDGGRDTWRYIVCPVCTNEVTVS